MQNFTQYTPTEILFGKNTEMQVGTAVKKWGGTKVLMVYGGGSVVRSGLLSRVEKSLDEAAISYVELGGVQPNPRLSLAEEGVLLAVKENVDFVLAVGGGSVIDTAKGIAHGAARPECKLWDLWTNKEPLGESLPVGCVLTIPAAGSEMSDSAVLTNTEIGKKAGISTHLNRPRFAIMNPELTMTLPDYQTACGCTDILMHTMERYFVSGKTMEITDTIAEALMRTVIQNSLILEREPNNYEARAEIMWAGSLSHNGLTGCGASGTDFTTHGLEHELSGLYDVAHGAGLAALWGSWARYVYKECLHRFYRFAIEVMGVVDEGSKEVIALKGIEATEDDALTYDYESVPHSEFFVPETPQVEKIYNIATEFLQPTLQNLFQLQPDLLLRQLQYPMKSL